LKGANLRAISAYLETKVAGVTQAQIQRETNLAWSSVRNVLKHGDVFVEENGLWRLRHRPAKTSAIANGAVADGDH
jgi:hypothetical protein